MLKTQLSKVEGNAKEVSTNRIVCGLLRRAQSKANTH